MAESTVTVGVDVSPDLMLALGRLQELQEEVRRQALMLASDVVRKQLSSSPGTPEKELADMAVRSVRAFIAGADVLVSRPGDEPGSPRS